MHFEGETRKVGRRVGVDPEGRRRWRMGLGCRTGRGIHYQVSELRAYHLVYVAKGYVILHCSYHLCLCD